jgi:hypothetical protein
MKRFLLLALAVLGCISFTCQAQEVYLSVAMPYNSSLDNNTKTLLKNKILGMITSQGIAATEFSAIAVVPEVTIIDEKIVEGGQRNIYTQQLEVTLIIRNIITNTVFNSLSLTCKGEGYNKSEAIRSAIKRINGSNTIFVDFITTSKQKIYNYYNEYTSLLVNKANTLASQQAYDEALALLSTYPEHLSGYSRVAQTIKVIFDKSQTQYCSQIILSARQAYSLRDYEKAAEIIALINSQSSCATEAKQLLSQIKKEVDNVYKEQVAIEREEIKSKERIQSQLITAARDISVAYFKRQTQYLFFW